MRKLILFGLFAIGLSLANCEKESDTTVVHGYFQCSYINYAWTPINKGWIIDQSGNIRSYKNPQKWNMPDSLGYISEQQLIDNISVCDTINIEVSSSDLANYNSLVEPASKGQMTTGQPGAFDIGKSTLYCYQFDKTKGKYKQILLSQTGDWIVSNTDPNAIKIVDWLITINLQLARANQGL